MLDKRRARRIINRKRLTWPGVILIAVRPSVARLVSDTEKLGTVANAIVLTKSLRAPGGIRISAWPGWPAQALGIGSCLPGLGWGIE